MTTILSIDPGKATGLAWGEFSDTDPYTLSDAVTLDFDQVSEVLWNTMDIAFPDVLVIERFVPQSGQDFTLKEDDLAAVEAIGMLRHALVPLVNETVWQLRSEKANVPDSVLKDNGLWQTGSMVNWKDGRDANDAIIHALQYLRKKDHRPTLQKYFRRSNNAN